MWQSKSCAVDEENSVKAIETVFSTANCLQLATNGNGKIAVSEAC